MRLKVSRTSRALVWGCATSLILTSGPWQVLAASAPAASSPSVSIGRSIARVGRVAAQPVRLETGAHAGQSGRLILRLRAESVAAAGVSVRWTARGPLASGATTAGVPVVVLEAATLPEVIEDVLAFEIEAGPGLMEESVVLVPEFTVEAEASMALVTATGTGGAPLRIALAPWQLWADATPTRLWDMAAPHAEPLPAGVQPTGRGVRLQHDFSSKRVAITPEITEQHGLAVKAAVGAALGPRAALGIVGGGGAGQQDVVVTGGVQVTPSQRLLVSAGALQQDVDLAFASGTKRRRLRQRAGGAAYRVGLGGPLQARIDAQAYFAESGSLDLGSVQYFEDAGGQAQIFRLDRRVAGAALFGAQGHTALQVGSDSTVTVSLGTERLRYAYATGDQVSQTLTRGIDWLQQLPHGLSLQAYARTQAAMHTTGVRSERRFGAQGHRFGVELTHIDGRNGVMDDTQLRVTQTFAFGGRPAIAPSARSYSGRQELGAPMGALVDEVTQRPAFLPLVLLAVVDPTVRAERLVAVEHDGMVQGSEINQETGTVTVPAAAVSITGITKNGAAFTNTGQFSLVGSALQIHPMHMEAPAAGIDQYVIFMQNERGGVTTATVDVSKGSIHILRVALETEEAPETPADTTPDVFSFVPVTGAEAGSPVGSNEIEVTGISGPAPISIVGGEYSIDGGAFTSTPGTVLPGQRVMVRVQAPAAAGGSATATLTIGDVSADFTVTTAAAVPVDEPDTTPDAFAFAAQTGVVPETVTTSNSVTLSGMTAPAGILVSGGEYSVDGGPFTSAPGTVLAGQAVRVRLTSSAAFSTTKTASVAIGGVSAPFHVTTADEVPVDDTTPDAFSFDARQDMAVNTAVASHAITVSGINAPAGILVSGGEYSIDGGPFTSVPGTVLNGQSVTVRLTTSAAFATTTAATLTIGGVSAEFSATTLEDPYVPDTTPDGFTFTPETDVALSTPTTSNSITVTGIDTPAAISIAGGEYSVDDGPFTASAMNVTNGQTVKVRLTSSASFATTTTATLTIGGVSGAFSVSTLGADTTPDAFAFTPQTGLAISTQAVSNSVTVSGINTATSISIVGGEYSLGSGYTASSGTVAAGDIVTVRLTSSASFSTGASATLTIGGVSGTFTVTTEAIDTTPDAFSFTAQTGVARSTPITSNAITVDGINTGASISVAGGEYSIDSAGFTSSAGTVTSGQSVVVRVTSSASFSTGASATLTVGGVSGTFTATTLAADTTPNAFSFITQTDVNGGSTRTSNSITVSGINAPAAISVSGHSSSRYSINNGTFTSTAGTVNNGDTVRVQHQASSSDNGVRTTTLTIGGVTGTFTTVTEDD